MKVFISWSGKRSKAMAKALKDWIPLIVQHAEPFVSDKDISAGDRWAQAIAGELENSNFGILCITPENISSEWIMFEAGALSKAMQDAKVIPLLFGLELSDLSGPLQQFQALKVDEQGMLDALKAINAASDNKTGDATIEQLVPALWSQLQEKIDAIPAKAVSEKHMRPQTEIMEDLVSQVRGLNTRMRDFDPEIMERGMHSSSSRYRNIYPMMMDEILIKSADTRSGSYGLLMVAGLFRDTMPWISEVLVEAHRDLKNASPKQARKVAGDLRRTLKFMTRSHFAEIMVDHSKHSHMMIMELPHLIERFIEHSEFQNFGDDVEGDIVNDGVN
ncbi:MAG TPA: toll/interleukin-1 receptor domain-containing protein [Rhizobiales bacterium]|nr:toll/interleukin-1 receptor domain-containing protein [Hyphomicrobiales bacterium]